MKFKTIVFIKHISELKPSGTGTSSYRRIRVVYYHKDSEGKLNGEETLQDVVSFHPHCQILDGYNSGNEVELTLVVGSKYTNSNTYEGYNPTLRLFDIRLINGH